MTTRSIDMPGDRFDWWLHLRLPAAAWMDGVDLLHLPANAAPAWCPVPFVTTVHDLIPLRVAGECSRNQRGKFRRGVQRAVRGARHIVVPSAATRDELTDEFDVSAERITVIPWAADRGVLEARSDGVALDCAVRAVRREYGLSARWLLNFSGSSRRKNAGGVIEGFARVPAAARDGLQLVLVGCEPASFREELSGLARGLGVASQCRLLGFVAHEHLPALLAGACGLLLPSLCEGFGLPMAMLEAAAAELPVIVTRVGSIPEVLHPLNKGARDALIVPPGDSGALAEAMAKLAEGPQLRRRIGALVRRLVADRWSVDHQADCLDTLYQRILGRPRRRRTRVDEFLVRAAAYPLHESARRRRTHAELRALRRLAGRSFEAVRNAAVRRLRDLLRFASRSLPYFSEQFETRGVDAGGERPLDELAKLPVLSKSAIRANAERMIDPAVPGGLQPMVTGGTSGDTLHFCVDRLRQAQSTAARHFAQELFGVFPGDRRMYLWGSPIELKRSRVRRLRDRLLNEIVLDAFDMSPAVMETYLARIRRFQPRVIYGYASAAAVLARYAAPRCRPEDFPWLRLFVLTADEVSIEDKRLVAETFGCSAAGEYGSREMGVIAHECPHGALHVISPHIHVEIVQGGRRVAAGQCGNIVCTTLNARGQPFVRYETGDVGSLSDKACPCGLPLPVLEIVGGRITGFVVLPDGRLCHGHLVAYLVRSDPSVVEFRVIQTRIDAFEVLLVVNDLYTPAVIDRMKQRFAEYFGTDVRVEGRLVDGIPPDPSGKRRHLVSLVAPNLDQFDIVGGGDAAPSGVVGSVQR